MDFKFQLTVEGDARLLAAAGDDGVAVIPDTWEGHPVTAIGGRSFYGKYDIKRVQLPKYLKKVEGHAFAECRFLEQVEFPEGTKSIGDYCFYNCIRLRRVVLPSTLTHMGYGAFKNDTDLKDIHIHTVQGMESQINTILSDTNFEQTVTFHYGDGVYRSWYLRISSTRKQPMKRPASSIIKPMVPGVFTETVSAVRELII